MQIKIKNDVLVEVPDDLSLMTPYVLLEQEDWFESEIEFVRHLLQPGMNVIDVGANYGTYTLTAAKLVGSRGSVLAFEPASKTADYLRCSIELNAFGNVRLLQCALSDHDGEASLSLSKNSELNTLQQSAGNNCETVRVRTLDDCYAELEPGSIDFWKLDAEGEEIKILAGASKFLAQQSPLIMFELKHGNEVNTGLIQKFEQSGFKIYVLVPGLNMLAPFDSNGPTDPFQLNLFACKDDRAGALEQRGLLTAFIDGKLPPLHCDKNLWAFFLMDKPYGNYFLPLYEPLLESETGDWPVYRQALNDYVSSHLPGTPSRHRLGSLTRCLATLTELLDGNLAAFSRLWTWARVAAEMGKRDLAAKIVGSLADAMEAGQIKPGTNEPFFPASERFESLDPAADLEDWYLSSVLEAASRLRSFSSYFSDAATLPILEKLSKSRYQSPEMERRRQLVRIRSGQQSAPEYRQILLAAGPDNLNREFWTGCLPKAQQLDCTMLQTQPGHPDVNHTLGVQLVQKGQYEAGLSHLRAALEADPSQGRYWLSYADALLASGQAVEAFIVIQTAMQSGLDTPAAHTLLQKAEAATQNSRATGSPERPVQNTPPHAKSNATRLPSSPPQAELDRLVTLFNAGRYAEVDVRTKWLLELHPNWAWGWKILGTALQKQGKNGAEALKRAVELAPDDAETHNNLGFMLHALGQCDAALASLYSALKIKPDFANAHNNLGIVLNDLGRVDAAQESYRQALKINPDFAEAHNNLGNSLKELAQLDDAVASFRRAIETAPGYAEAYNNLGNTLDKQGRAAEAEASLRRALEIRPDYAEAYYNLALAFKGQGQTLAAQESYRRALTISPGFAEAYNNLGAALKEEGELEAALACYQRALKITPDFAEAHNNLAIALKDKGEFNAAQASYRRALAIKSDYAEAHSNMLMAMQYTEGHTPAELFAEHLAYAMRFEAPLKNQWPAHQNSRDLGKRLKIGYVSPDFRKHSVAYFIESVLTHHDREKVDVFCYYNHSLSDDVTLRLKSLVEHWYDISNIDNETLAHQIRNDGIDILVDLAGHTAGNRLPTFARRPAPVQASWLGYPYTTGLSSIDYRISDHYADPIGMNERYYSEKLYRLPATSTCYRPPHPSPEVGPLPALARGRITFGSFNNLTKVTPEVRALWAQTLLATPGSRLLLKANSLADIAARQRLIAEFAGYGIAEERLILAHQDNTHLAHLERYNQIDIGLDPFPYNGVTTSFEAMWMGVPVVALAGNSYVSRMGVSILSNLGLTDLLAETPQDYLTIATRLASDPERLAELRGGLRERLTSSPLADGKRFTLDLENAYRNMWQAFVAESNSGTHRWT